MSREYGEDSMLKSKGIEYFPPIKDFNEAFETFQECGGMIISLEEDGFLVDEPIKISRLYDIKTEHLELYFRDALTFSDLSKEDIDVIISKWIEEENINTLE